MQPLWFECYWQYNSQVKTNFAFIFNNIDGAASNFDSFLAHLGQHKTKFSVIGIAETNIHEEHGDLYSIPGYNSKFQSKLDGKIKGSGVGIFLKENLVYEVCDNLSQCTNNLETLFVKVTNLTKPIYFGVIYRPPSAESIKNSISELESIVKMLPNEDVYLAGDYNIDLLKPSPNLNDFEELLFSNSLIPTISTATHFKPNCIPSCIDNILTCSSESIKVSGVLDPMISHHSPIFCIIDTIDNLEGSKIKPITSQKYDYCQQNINKFVDLMDTKISALILMALKSLIPLLKNQWIHVLKSIHLKILAVETD